MKMYQKLIAIVFLSIFSCVANAVPSVATDIAPVHSLVSQVMAGVGEPTLLVQSGASPHNYSLSPSEAQALQDADLVFWIGEGLTPWLERSLENLAPDSQKIELLEAKGTTTYAFREGATFDAHDDSGHEMKKEDEHGAHDGAAATTLPAIDCSLSPHRNECWRQGPTRRPYDGTADRGE